MNRRRSLGRILAATAAAVAVLSSVAVAAPTALASVATRTDTGQLTLASDRAAYTDVLTVQLLVSLLVIYPLASLTFGRARKQRRH